MHCEHQKNSKGFSIADLIRLGLTDNSIITAVETSSWIVKGNKYRVKFKIQYDDTKHIEEQCPSVLLAEITNDGQECFDLHQGIGSKLWHIEFEK